MYKIWSFLLILILSYAKVSFANETCSRTATINYQKVLVDGGSGKRGEGLRFYLEKDAESKKLLDEYQENDQPTFWRASTSTLGSLMLITGLVQNSNSGSQTQSNQLIYGGSILIALSYLVSKTIKVNNEKLLSEAVKEYNKRNTPRIYFSPYKDNNGGSTLEFGIQQEF